MPPEQSFGSNQVTSCAVIRYRRRQGRQSHSEDHHSRQVDCRRLLEQGVRVASSPSAIRRSAAWPGGQEGQAGISPNPCPRECEGGWRQMARMVGLIALAKHGEEEKIRLARFCPVHIGGPACRILGRMLSHWFLMSTHPGRGEGRSLLTPNHPGRGEGRSLLIPPSWKRREPE